MSTGLNCEFVLVGERWYYVLEHGSAPKNAWDWREFATAWGPFSSFAEADAHLRRWHANPGGHSGGPDDDPTDPDEVLVRLIAEART